MYHWFLSVGVAVDFSEHVCKDECIGTELVLEMFSTWLVCVFVGIANFDVDVFQLFESIFFGVL